MMDLSPGRRRLPTIFRAGRIKRSSVVVDITPSLMKNPVSAVLQDYPGNLSPEAVQNPESGHDFSRADQANQMNRALAPAEAAFFKQAPPTVRRLRLLVYRAKVIGYPRSLAFGDLGDHEFPPAHHRAEKKSGNVFCQER